MRQRPPLDPSAPGSAAGGRDRLRPRARPALAAGVVGVGVVVAGAWWEGDRPWPTTAAHVSVLATVAVVVITALVAGRGRQRLTTGTWARATARGLGSDRKRAGVAGWVLLVALAVAWDLVSFTGGSDRLPTFSRLAGDVTGRPGGRAVAFALWVALGLVLALAGRRRSR